MLKDFTAKYSFWHCEPHQIRSNSDGITLNSAPQRKSFNPFKLHFSSWQRAANKLIVLQMPGEGIDGKVCPARGLDIYLVN